MEPKSLKKYLLINFLIGFVFALIAFIISVVLSASSATYYVSDIMRSLTGFALVSLLGPALSTIYFWRKAKGSPSQYLVLLAIAGYFPTLLALSWVLSKVYWLLKINEMI